MSTTDMYVSILANLKEGDLGLLRSHAGQGLDETVEGFDLFAGLWWPLRQKSERVPRREVAWLIAKLYAFRPIKHSQDEMFAYQLGKCRPHKDTESKHFMQRFDRMLMMPLDRIEPSLQWALDILNSNHFKLDWVKLTDDLSIWERESTRLKWANQFLQNK